MAVKRQTKNAVKIKVPLLVRGQTMAGLGRRLRPTRTRLTAGEHGANGVRNSILGYLCGLLLKVPIEPFRFCAFSWPFSGDDFKRFQMISNGFKWFFCLGKFFFLWAFDRMDRMISLTLRAYPCGCLIVICLPHNNTKRRTVVTIVTESLIASPSFTRSLDLDGCF